MITLSGFDCIWKSTCTISETGILKCLFEHNEKFDQFYFEFFKILIVDEATASLDAVNESFIHANIAALMANKTVVIIAHRLSTVRNADQVKGLIVNDVINITYNFATNEQS